mmetsp:Transcript_4562/g.11502  ORF Transcript_4562/g.11502 Transcript_4562/m.11502 type:complete len:223 (+) Transcript_4562:1434-2102(+)
MGSVTWPSRGASTEPSFTLAATEAADGAVVFSAWEGDAVSATDLSASFSSGTAADLSPSAFFSCFLEPVLKRPVTFSVNHDPPDAPFDPLEVVDSPPVDAPDDGPVAFASSSSFSSSLGSAAAAAASSSFFSAKPASSFILANSASSTLITRMYFPHCASGKLLRLRSLSTSNLSTVESPATFSVTTAYVHLRSDLLMNAASLTSRVLASMAAASREVDGSK